MTTHTPTLLDDDGITELSDLLKSIRPEYGAVGSRDVDVTAQRKRIDRAIALLARYGAQNLRNIEISQVGAPIAAQEPVASTSAATWRMKGEPDPHGNQYDCERAALCMGNLTDDELANAAFMNYDQRPPMQDIIDGKACSPIAYMTAVKDRIRWLSRALAAATPQPPTSAQPAAIDADFVADLERSRTKYPGNARMFDGLMGEIDELRRAYAGDGDIRAEAFDVAVCAYRIATEGDAGGNTLLAQPAASAEPAGYFYQWELDRSKKAYPNGFPDAIPVFTAPVAAQPSVPSSLDYSSDRAPLYVTGWNDCRAAMLKAAPTPPAGGQAQHDAEIARLNRTIEILKEDVKDWSEQALELKAQQDADRVDAERYRWLRENSLAYSDLSKDGQSGWAVVRRDSSLRRVFPYNGNELDVAIDAARAQRGGQS